MVRKPQRTRTICRTDEWRCTKQQTLVEQCREKKQGRPRMAKEDLWLGDCEERGENTCALTCFRFIEQFEGEWRDKEYGTSTSPNVWKVFRAFRRIFNHQPSVYLQCSDLVTYERYSERSDIFSTIILPSACGILT
jgi:hypothetical protein